MSWTAATFIALSPTIHRFWTPFSTWPTKDTLGSHAPSHDKSRTEVDSPMLQSVASQSQRAVRRASPVIELLPKLVQISDASFFFFMGIYVNLFEVKHFSTLAFARSNCLLPLLVVGLVTQCVVEMEWCRKPFFLLIRFCHFFNTLLAKFSHSLISY